MLEKSLATSWRVGKFSKAEVEIEEAEARRSARRQLVEEDKEGGKRRGGTCILIKSNNAYMPDRKISKYVLDKILKYISEKILENVSNKIISE